MQRDLGVSYKERRHAQQSNGDNEDNRESKENEPTKEIATTMMIT